MDQLLGYDIDSNTHLNYEIPVLEIVLVVFPGGQRLRGGIGDVWGRLRSFSEGHRRQGQEQAPVRIE